MTRPTKIRTYGQVQRIKDRRVFFVVGKEPDRAVTLLLPRGSKHIRKVTDEVLYERFRRHRG